MSLVRTRLPLGAPILERTAPWRATTVTPVRSLAWLVPLTLLLATGCAGDGDTPVPSDSPSGSPTAASSRATPEPTPDAAPEVLNLTGRDLAGFTALDGQIACLFDGGSGADAVRCDVLENSWTPPPKPQDCQGDWGLAVGLTADGSPGTFLCISDTVVGIRGSTDGRRELPADTLAVYGVLACLVQDNGVSCYDTTSGEHSVFVTPLTYEVI